MPPFPIDPEKDTICDVIRRWAEIQPDAPAFSTEHKTPLTYAGLMRVMEGILDSLNGAGLGRGDRIGVVHSGGAAMASTLIGVMSGSTAVPINPVSTLEEFVLHLRDRGANALLIGPGIGNHARVAAQELGLDVFEVVETDADVCGDIGLETGITRQPSLGGPAGPDDVAYVVQTSGTTSMGKIVPIGHDHLLARMQDAERFYRMDSTNR